MTAEQDKWLKLKNNYLRQVEQALAATGHPKSGDVLRDVDEHLDRKYAELSADKQNWEGYQQILIDMGPPDEYAELLAEENMPADKRGFGINTFLAVVFVVVLMVVGGYLIYTAGKKPAVPAASVEKTYHFEPDERVLGTWETIDFVQTIDDFDPSEKNWPGDLYLKELVFKDNGLVSWTNVDDGPYHHLWSKGKVDPDSQRPAFYYLKPIDGTDYLFFEWISGDVTQRGDNPGYYVLTQHPKVIETELSGETIQTEEPKQPLEERSLRIVQDRSNPFDPAVVGEWVSVDFVPEITYFKVGQIQWKGDFNLKTLTFFADGTTSGPWTWRDDILRHPDDQTNAHFAIEHLEGAAYLFLEWINGDVIYRGQKPWYYVLKKASSSVQAMPGKGHIQVASGNCTSGYVQSLLGPPQRIDYDGRLLDYPDYLINFWFSQRGPLSEIRLNRGCRAQLPTGISTASGRQAVFAAYGEPIRTLEADDLHRKNDDRILYQKDDASRIYYDQQGLIFWFRNDTVNQIVVLKGSLIFE